LRTVERFSERKEASRPGQRELSLLSSGAAVNVIATHYTAQGVRVLGLKCFVASLSLRVDRLKHRAFGRVADNFTQLSEKSILYTIYLYSLETCFSTSQVFLD